MISVPEPSSWAMMLLGLAGLGYAAWRGGRKGERVYYRGVDRSPGLCGKGRANLGHRPAAREPRGGTSRAGGQLR